jgi:protein TonB
VEGGIFSGVEGGTGPVDVTQTFREAAVDERPERLSGPLPRYPEMLRQAGIEGVVMLEFVIDTTGHVEAGSVKILQSTNRAFEGPAKVVIERSLYRPGRVRGQAVRVLVSQQIGFTIQRDD